MSTVVADGSRPGHEASVFERHLVLRLTQDASAYADELFRESFGMDFPVPRSIKFGEVETAPRDWWQAVALYRWPDGTEECVGFANWIRFRNVYLGGALCVKKDFYRRLPRDLYRQCRERGGIAQIVMEFGDRTLPDCDGWFGYCGDTKAFRVDSRVGFVATRHPYIIVKWVKSLPESEKMALIDEVSTVGQF
jgi:hypothetical protein